jgi:cell division protein FtsB
VALAAVIALVILGTSFPWSVLVTQHGQLSSASAQLHALQTENRLLAEQEQQLNSNAEINRLARQDYQMVMPGQTLYDVLPPSGLSTSSPGDATSGDPGDQPLVAPANAPNMTPDPGLPQAPPSTDPSTTKAGKDAAASTGTAGTGSAPAPSSFWSRVTNTLEFWK